MSPENELETGRQLAGLSLNDLWYAYISLGGSSPISVLRRNLADPSTLTPHEHDVIAHAINERFVDLGANHPVPYQRPS